MRTLARARCCGGELLCRVGVRACTESLDLRLQAEAAADRLAPPADRPWCLSDFTFGPVLGTGSFGRVALATEKRSGGRCAVKTLSKAHIVKNQQASL